MIHITCCVSHLILSFFIISMILETVSSDPVHVSRWLHPCRGRTVIRRPLLSTQAPEPGTDDAVAEKLFIQAQEMVELVNNTTIEYFTERIQSNLLRDDLDTSFSFSGFPLSIVIPTTTNFVEHLKEDYRRASIVAVFLEEARTGEAVSSSHSFLTWLRALESKLYSFLCQIYNALEERSALNLAHVGRDVMSVSDRYVQTESERFNRDYKILLNTARLFWAIARGYNGFR